MDLDKVAEAIYNARPRRIPWEELSEKGWKAEYRRMAEAAMQAIQDHRHYGEGAMTGRPVRQKAVEVNDLPRSQCLGCGDALTPGHECGRDRARKKGEEE